MKFIFILLLHSALLCWSTMAQTKLKSGDIIFRRATEQKISSAIDEVTTANKASVGFSHMGVVFIKNDSVFVYHSSPEKGVNKTTLSEFTQSKNSSIQISVVYRIKDITKKEIRSAHKEAKKLIGQPYNFTYILEDEGVYCSEFVYTLFPNHFAVNPMTFKVLGKDEFHPTWIRYYDKLGIEVPEGLLGCNPNGMSQNKDLILIETIQK